MRTIAGLGRHATLCSSVQKRSVSAVFSPQEWRSFVVDSVVDVSHDTKLFKVALPSPAQTSGMPIASCIMVQARATDGSIVARPYTPVSHTDVKGHISLIIKKYPRGVVSSSLHALRAGDSINIKGPFPKISYKPNVWKHIGMLAGGTGLAPMVQILNTVLSNPSDCTKVSLVLANKTEDDILLRSMLELWARLNKNFRLWHVLEKPPGPEWAQGTGRVNMEMIQNHMPSPNDEGSIVMVCGPPGFMEAISGDKAPDKSQGELKGLLHERGFTAAQVYKF